MDNVLCEETSPKEDILRRYVAFSANLKMSPSLEVATVSRIEENDISTIHGANLALIREKTVGDPMMMSRMQLKNDISFRMRMPDDQGWVKESLHELLDERIQLDIQGGEEKRTSIDMINESIHALCTI